MSIEMAVIVTMLTMTINHIKPTPEPTHVPVAPVTPDETLDMQMMTRKSSS
jgi:hypothetical protein